MTNLMTNKRPVKRLVLAGHTVDYTVRGSYTPQVTRIEPYNENGEMAPHIWFAVYAKGTIIARVNSSHVAEVQYD